MGKDAQFKELLVLIEPRIARQATMLQEPISNAERLTIAIRFIATGETFKCLHFQFRRSRSAISYIVIECCLAIYELSGPTSPKVPSSEEEWLVISSVFEKRWNFPKCLGTVDGKHIVIQKPHWAVSEFYNYEGTQSIVLLELGMNPVFMKLLKVISLEFLVLKHFLSEINLYHNVFTADDAFAL